METTALEWPHKRQKLIECILFQYNFQTTFSYLQNILLSKTELFSPICKNTKLLDYIILHIRASDALITS